MFKLLKQKENLLLGIGGVLFVLLLWYLVTLSEKIINPIFLSSPADVFKELIPFFIDGSIWPDLAASASEFITGFALAIGFGLSMGFILGWFKRIRATTNALVFALYSTPVIAIIPLIILWFGFGFTAKVIIVFLASFFPILISVSEAVKNIDPNLLKLAKSFMASDLKTLLTIVVPNSVPNIISGIKIALPRAIIGMIIGEFYTGNIGLGYLISYYGATFQTARLLAIVILIVLVSVTLTLSIDFFMKKTKTWNL